MKRIPIVTSIPPRLSRKTPHGADFGTDYQEQCIDSWIRAGFAPVSVNCGSERIPCSDKLRTVQVAQTAVRQFGKPLVWVSDLLRIASELGPGPVAIINADILIEPRFDLLGVVETLERDQALIAQRIDIASLDDCDGSLFPHGYDFFAVQAENLRKLPDMSLAVGIPWWDHYLPMSLYATGVRVFAIRDPFAYHVIHEERWDESLWYDVGVEYLKDMEAFLSRTNPDDAYTRFLSGIRDQLSQVKPPTALSRLRRKISPAYRARKMRKEAGRALEARALGQAATGTVEFIDQRFSASTTQLREI